MIQFLLGVDRYETVFLRPLFSKEPRSMNALKLESFRLPPGVMNLECIAVPELETPSKNEELLKKS
jgi:hypothetical protein